MYSCFSVSIWHTRHISEYIISSEKIKGISLGVQFSIISIQSSMRIATTEEIETKGSDVLY